MTQFEERLVDTSEVNPSSRSPDAELHCDSTPVCQRARDARIAVRPSATRARVGHRAPQPTARTRTPGATAAIATAGPAVFTDIKRTDSRQLTVVARRGGNEQRD